MMLTKSGRARCLAYENRPFNNAGDCFKRAPDGSIHSAVVGEMGIGPFPDSALAASQTICSQESGVGTARGFIIGSSGASANRIVRASELTAARGYGHALQ